MTATIFQFLQLQEAAADRFLLKMHHFCTEPTSAKKLYEQSVRTAGFTVF